MKLNLNAHAKEFLISHNWKIEEEYGSHPCFPIMEDFSKRGCIVDFCEEFYKEAWHCYILWIKDALELNSRMKSKEGAKK